MTNMTPGEMLARKLRGDKTITAADRATCAIAALRIGSYYGKQVGQELVEKYKLPLLMQKTATAPAPSNALLCFMKEFLPQVFNTLFKNTETGIAITISTKTPYPFPNTFRFKCQTHKTKKEPE